MFRGIVLAFSSVIVSAISQVLLKVSASKTYSVWWRDYVNLYVISAYALFLSVTVLNIFALKYIPLTLGSAIEASGQIAVPVMGRLFLHEKIGRKKWIGMAVIALGIAIFAF